MISLYDNNLSSTSIYTSAGAVPKGHIDELITGLRTIYERGMGYPDLSKEMTADFARPAFYNELYEIWGLEQGDELKR